MLRLTLDEITARDLQAFSDYWIPFSSTRDRCNAESTITLSASAITNDIFVTLGSE